MPKILTQIQTLAVESQRRNSRRTILSSYPHHHSLCKAIALLQPRVCDSLFVGVKHRMTLRTLALVLAFSISAQAPWTPPAQQLPPAPSTTSHHSPPDV